MAHVLFVDLVGYSAVPRIEEQAGLVEELQALIRADPHVAQASAAADLLRLPTGDGVALVFFRDPVAPVRTAMGLAQHLAERPHLRLRMGLHSGPVYRIADINANENVSGGGINLAQRVMDAGDAGHILLSAEIVGYLRQVGQWPIHDLGECEVKHGERLRLYSLHTEAIGNSRVPTRLRAPTPTPASVGLRVALLYKRNTEPDITLLDLLETHLKGEGFRVFVDRHLEVGMKWAEEIDRQVRGSDAIIPLLSERSISSEMLAHEIQIADEAAQLQGKPRILPVRVAYEGDLPEALAAVLDPLEYALWQGPPDSATLCEALGQALRRPPRASPAVPKEKLEPPGGAVPLDSQFYVIRPADEEFRAAIRRGDSIVLVKGARQMGKTSLLARGLQQARDETARVVRTDFQKLNARHLESAEALFMTLAESIAEQLDLDAEPQELWSERRGPSENFERFWRRGVLREVAGRVVWGLDEVDRLFTCDFGSEVFGLFRSWHNERALDPEGPWQRLTLAIAYATEAHLFITDVNQSPFNVGTRLALQDFNRDQVRDLNARYGAPLRDEGELGRFYALLAGHPYLVRRGLHEIAVHDLEVASFEAQADRDEGIFGDHLRRILVLLARDPALTEVVRTVLQGEPCPTAESFYRLRSAGVMAGEAASQVRLRCRLYQSYLSRHLIP